MEVKAGLPADFATNKSIKETNLSLKFPMLTVLELICSLFWAATDFKSRVSCWSPVIIGFGEGVEIAFFF